MKTNCAIETLHIEMEWLQKVINQVISSYLMHEGHEKRWQDMPIPDLSNSDSPYAKIVNEWNLNSYERLAITLAMTPHLKPEVLDVFFGRNTLYDRGFTEFGGVIDKEHSGFLPTGQTLLFLVTANNPELRIEVMHIFNIQNKIIEEQLLSLSDTSDYISDYNGVLSISSEWLHYFITGEQQKTEFSSTFPAVKINTSLDWNDLVLNDEVMEQVLEINTWLKHSNTLMNDWNLKSKIKPGYRALFYGSSGTGKALTTKLLGKSIDKEVYKVDLSMVVSKYIGETEKNLAKIFDRATHNDWILFFDEADALFGKRTAVNSSNDRHVNQQTAYLLQRIEDFTGVIILSSNLKANMDEAFTRRFQSMIHFTMPSPNERFQLWQNAFSETCQLDSEIDLKKIAEDYEISGGSIVNVLRYSALTVIKRNARIVTKAELLNGIKREFKRANKTISNVR